MKRWIYHHRTVVGDPAQLNDLLRARVRELFAEATGTGEVKYDSDGSFTAQLEARVLGVDTAREIRVSTGVATMLDQRVRIPLEWHVATGKALFPRFEGALELEPLSRTSAKLTLVGAYQVPLGPLGAAADATGLHAVATGTAEHLIEQLAQALADAATAPPSLRPAAPWPSLALLVRDVMTKDPAVIADTLSLRTAAMLLFHLDISGVPVVDEHGELVGVLSEADLLDKAAQLHYGVGRKARDAERRRDAVTAGEACSRPARVTAPDVPLREAAHEMLANDVSRLVVLDASRIAGIVTRHDVLRALMRSESDIEAAVDTVLSTLDEPEIKATVEWGVVTVSGMANLRSRVPHIVRLLREIDGIIDVQADLDWRTDDVFPTSLPTGM